MDPGENGAEFSDEFELDYRRIQPVCLALLASGQEQRWSDLQENLGKLRKIIFDGDSPFQSSHLLELSSYVTLPLRILLKKGSMPESATIATLDLMASVLEYTSLSQWTSAQDILTQLFMLISSSRNADVLLGSETLKISALNCIATIYAKCLSKDMKLLLYSDANLAFLGHTIYVVLKMLEKEQSIDLKTPSLKILNELSGFKQSEKSDLQKEISKSFASLLPGCLTVFTKACCQQQQHSIIVVNSVRLWAYLYCLVSGDEVFNHPDGHSEKVENSLGVNRTPDWFETTGKNSAHLANTVCSTLVTHDNFEVRQSLLEFCGKLLLDCTRTLEGSRSAFIDTVAVLINDEYSVVSYRAETLLAQLQQRACWTGVYATTEEKIYQLCTALPRLVRDHGSLGGGQSALKQLCGYMKMIGSKGMRKLCTSSAHLRRLTSALCQILEFDMHKIGLVSEFENAESLGICSVMSGESTVDISLKYFRNQTVLKELCYLIGRFSDSATIIDHMIDLSEENCRYYEAQAFFLLNSILAAPHLCLSEDLCDFVVETYVSRLETISLDLIPEDREVCDVRLSSSKETVVAHIILHGLATCAQCLKDKFSGTLVLRTLYPILECATSSQMFIRDTAFKALEAIAGVSDGKLCGLLARNADYLLYSISMKLRHLEANLRSPLVFCFFLQNSEKEMFISVKDLISEVLFAVDSHYMTHCLLLMKVLLEFTKSVAKWFPPNEEKDKVKFCDDDSEGEERPQVPVHIRMVVDILKRTKHIVSSPHLPLRLVTLDLIVASLKAVSDYENELLPMIHQNWPGVLCRFDDSERSVGCKSFEVHT